MLSLERRCRLIDRKLWLVLWKRSQLHAHTLVLLPSVHLNLSWVSDMDSGSEFRRKLCSSLRVGLYRERWTVLFFRSELCTGRLIAVLVTQKENTWGSPYLIKHRRLRTDCSNRARKSFIFDQHWLMHLLLAVLFLNLIVTWMVRLDRVLQERPCSFILTMVPLFGD